MYTYKSRVRYSEVDKNGKLSIEALLNYFQDCSTFHSEDIGLGIAYLTKNKRAWVMTAWQIVVDRYPDLGEHIIAGTAPYEFKGFIGYRNFLLQTLEGEQLACANSVWTLLDTEQGRPARLSQEMIEGYRLEEKLPMDYASRKIEFTGEGQKLEPIHVRSYHLDTNNHVNNGQYISMAMGCIERYKQDLGSWREESAIRQLRAEYRKSALLGDTIYPWLIEKENHLLGVSLQDENGTVFCNIELMREKSQ